MKDFYNILGVPENAHEQDIKLAYRRLAKRYHPDVNPGDAHAEERFKEISDAYNTLSDPLLKSAYDRKRLKRNIFSEGSAFFYKDPQKEKKDPRKKEYSQEDLDRARANHRKRTQANMARRKKILGGMIVTFILFLFAAAGFEHWMDLKNNEEAEERKKYFNKMDSIAKVNALKQHPISSTDSPYDSIFGPEVYSDLSENRLVIYSPLSDAIICAVQAEKPFHTIRNEFIAANANVNPYLPSENAPIVFRHLPNGSYFLKVYTGSNWDFKKKIPGEKISGGFKNDEQFFKIEEGPFKLINPTRQNLNTHCCDTIVIDPGVTKMKRITKQEFFFTGEK